MILSMADLEALWEYVLARPGQLITWIAGFVLGDALLYLIIRLVRSFLLSVDALG